MPAYMNKRVLQGQQHIHSQLLVLGLNHPMYSVLDLMGTITKVTSEN